MLKKLVYSNGTDEICILCQPKLIKQRVAAIRANKEYKNYKLIDEGEYDEALLFFPPETPKPLYVPWNK